MIAPVSVCHQVSTTGESCHHRSPPGYQIQASGLIGSPTDPISRRLERSKPSGTSRPTFMNVRMAVGAVYRIVTPYFWMRLPPPTGVRGVRGALVQHAGRGVREGPVHDVAVPGDPTDVGGARSTRRSSACRSNTCAVRERHLGEVTAAGVQDAFRLAGSTARVEDEQRVLRLEPLGATCSGSGSRARRVTTGRARRSR